MSEIGENWYDSTPCRGLHEMFDLDPDERRGVDHDAVKLCLTICDACPVRMECLLDALQYFEQEGIRGGLSPNQRRKLLPVGMKPWKEVRLDVLAERKSAAENDHGFGRTRWQNGCNCSRCSVYSDQHKEYKRDETARRRKRNKLSTGEEGL